jgi:hypothetical protein
MGTRDATAKGAFAATAFADDAEGFARLEREGDVAHRLQRTGAPAGNRLKQIALARKALADVTHFQERRIRFKCIGHAAAPMRMQAAL